MGKRLTDNLSSLYIGASNQLQSKKARKKIVAYVESYDDIFFWRTLFADYEDENFFFEVMLPSKTTLAKGKRTVLTNELGSKLGENMIACVDSDYDYLLQGVTNVSRYILENKYVFHTYAYSIENYLCYAEALHEVCVMATLNDRMLIDFPEFMKMYSQIAYPLFLWSIWFYRKRMLPDFSLLDFCSFVRIDQVSVHHPERSLQAMERRVNRKLEMLREKYPQAIDDLEPLGRELRELGVNPDNTYMFIQGHHIMDNVVMKLIVPVCNVLKHEREQEIMNLAEHLVQRNNETISYERRQVDVGEVIKKHTNYKKSPLFHMIEKEVEEFLKSLD